MKISDVVEECRTRSHQHDAHVYVPTSFNPHDDTLAGFPRKLLWTWDSAEYALSIIHPAVVMMRAPLFWQLEAPLWRAAQQNGAAIFVNDAGNMPLGRSAMHHASADTIVTDAHDGMVFSRYLKDAQTPFPRGWILVHDINNLVDISDVHAGESTLVFQEIHLFPGVPMFVQCERLARMRARTFHVAPHGSTTSKPHPMFSGPKDDPMPLTDIEIPIRITDTGTCACGEVSYAIS